MFISKNFYFPYNTYLDYNYNFTYLNYFAIKIDQVSQKYYT